MGLCLIVFAYEKDGVTKVNNKFFDFGEYQATMGMIRMIEGTIKSDFNSDHVSIVNIFPLKREN